MAGPRNVIHAPASGRANSLAELLGRLHRNARMSASGYKRTLWGRTANVRFNPESGHAEVLAFGPDFTARGPHLPGALGTTAPSGIKKFQLFRGSHLKRGDEKW